MWPFKKKYKIIIEESYDDFTQIMTIKYSDGSIKKYAGASTVWHEYPDFKRCEISTEFWLSNVYTKIKHNKILTR